MKIYNIEINGKNIEIVKDEDGFFIKPDLSKGFGSALKPAHEDIVVARKPLSEKSLAENVLKWGTGGINIDGCRVGSEGGTKITDIDKDSNTIFDGGIHKKGKIESINEGRFPTNFILECSCEGDTHTDPNCPCYILDKQSNGSARFFYNAKVSKKERNMGLDSFENKLQSAAEFRPNHMEKALNGEDGNPYGRYSPTKNTHPTLKPVQLMAYLVRLVTPPNGVVLDPFMGSGSTGIATLLEGFSFIGMELESEYFKIAEARINSYEKYREFIKK